MGAWISFVPLMVLLLAAAAMDLRSRRIPNWLTLTVMGTGLAQAALPWTGITLWQSFAGLALGFALMFALFVLGALGGGDVKLMAGVGAWVGAWPVLLVFAGASIVGMLIVLAQCAARGRLMVLMRNTGLLVLQLLHIRALGVQSVAESGSSCRSVDKPLPYAVAVLIATALVLAMPHRLPWS